MLENLRQILDEDNRIENENELMVEATDSDMIDMFIDEDGEAEIPESELNKILSKIPEYNHEEELNKKLKRLTESFIPDYDEIVEEGKKLDQKLRDVTRKTNDVTANSKKALAVAGGTVGALSAITGGLGIPSIAIVSAVGAASTLATANLNTKQFKKKVYKYTKGEPITKSTVTKLLKACSTIRDISKFEVWLDDVDKGFTLLFKDDNPKVAEQAKKFRQWLDDEIYNKKLPEKRKEIQDNLKKKIKNKISKESFDFDDELYSREELIDMMEEEASLYEDGEIIEEDMDYFDSDYDTLEESKESRDAKFDAKIEKENRDQANKITDIKELEVTLRKNKELYDQITSAINTKEAKLDDSKIKRLLSEFKDRILFVRYNPHNPGKNTPLSILERNLRNNKICEKVLRERIKELKKSNKKATKESMSVYETAQSIVDDIF